MEVDPRISAINAQPYEVSWCHNGIIHRHTPDFEIIRLGKPSCIEVKPVGKASEPIIIERTASISSILGQEGIRYHVLTDLFIRRQPTLSNAKVLLHGLGCEPSPEKRDSVLAVLAGSPNGLRIAEVCQLASEAPEFANSVFAMVMSGAVQIVDKGAPLNALSLVRTSSPGER
jgi:hypothetical protein